MNNNESANLFRLKSPYFPALGEVFIAISSGDYSGNGIPSHFGEFFIFSTKWLGNAVGKRVYVQQHMLAGGADEIFQVAKARAVAELSDEIAKRLGLNDSVSFDGEFVLEDGSWDQVATLYSAGLLNQNVLEDIAYKTRSSTTLDGVRRGLKMAVHQFDETIRR
jgi:hypothetical protein